MAMHSFQVLCGTFCTAAPSIINSAVPVHDATYLHTYSAVSRTFLYSSLYAALCTYNECFLYNYNHLHQLHFVYREKYIYIYCRSERDECQVTTALFTKPIGAFSLFTCSRIFPFPFRGFGVEAEWRPQYIQQTYLYIYIYIYMYVYLYIHIYSVQITVSPNSGIPGFEVRENSQVYYFCPNLFVKTDFHILPEKQVHELTGCLYLQHNKSTWVLFSATLHS